MEKPPATSPPDIPFVNEVRLNGRNWLAFAAILVVIIWGSPRLWKKIERFDTSTDYRIPYSLSKDYWLYQRRLEQKTSSTNILVIGDSVVWGEYVLPDGSLSHFLNEQTASRRFFNAGVNGLYPLAIEGLIKHYSGLENRKIILHLNLLWMSSPKADLQENKPQQVNHSRLLPQFQKIPSYKPDANERLSVLVERNLQFMSWVTHLQTAYFEDKSIPAWTLTTDDSDPPRYPNAYKNPLRQITLHVPVAPATDPERGPSSPRHKPWTESGATATHFDWVQLDKSLQWAAFKRALQDLTASGNDVLVVIGPFNEHMISEENKLAFRQLRDGAVEFLKISNVPFVQPEVLPSPLYADGSHPLTDGYKELAARLLNDKTFQSWFQKSR